MATPLLDRALLAAFVVGGSAIGALVTGFSGDSGPSLVFLVLAACTLLFFLSGVSLLLLRRPYSSTTSGRIAKAVFLGVIVFVGTSVLLLHIYTTYFASPR